MRAWTTVLLVLLQIRDLHGQFRRRVDPTGIDCAGLASRRRCRQVCKAATAFRNLTPTSSE